MHPQLIPPVNAHHSGTKPNRASDNEVFMKDFEVHAEVVPWSKAPLTAKQIDSYTDIYHMWLKRRQEHYRAQLREYRAKYPEPRGYIAADLGISHYQFELAIEVHSLTGEDPAKPSLADIQSRELEYLNEKYALDQYTH